MSKYRCPETEQKRAKVLGAYKKVGSKFISPFSHKIGPITGINYGRRVLPELIWWDSIIDKKSHRFAADLAATIATHFKERNKTEVWWGFTSDYYQLNNSDFDELKKLLHEHNMLLPLQDALKDFLGLYPECPLIGFLDVCPSGAVDIAYLSQFEKRMADAEDKRSRIGILIQSQVVYMGFVIGKLFVKKGLGLANFPEIEKYPDTEPSLQVGALVCAAVNLFSGQMLPEYQNNNWLKYFWERSFELRPIKMDHLTI